MNLCVGLCLLKYLQQCINLRSLLIMDTNYKKYARLSLFVAGMSMLSTQASADYFGLGLGLTTEFLGSDESTVIPVANFEITTRLGILKNDQLGAQLDLVKSGTIGTGPILRINTGRNDSVSDSVVAALPEVEASLEAGWFVGSGFKLSSIGLASDAIVIGRLSVVSDTGDGHGGSQVNASVGLVTQLSDDLRIIPSVSINYGDDKYTQAFYGVDGANASTELGAFNASGGIESTQFAIVGIRKINEKWSVTGVGAYNTLQGDAAESPITKRGSETSVFTSLSINYTF